MTMFMISVICKFLLPIVMKAVEVSHVRMNSAMLFLRVPVKTVDVVLRHGQLFSWMRLPYVRYIVTTTVNKIMKTLYVSQVIIVFHIKVLRSAIR